jgi:RNA polymerase sigma factor (sigma-70 family)
MSLSRAASFTPALPSVSNTGPAESALLALTTGLARGDDAVWQQFHRDYGPSIFRQLLGATRGDHDLATESLQQTYLRVARYARPCESEIMFTAWLRTVARSALNDHLRRRRSFRDLLLRGETEPDTLPEAAATAANEDRVLASLDTALARIGAENRALLEAKYFGGTPVRTLAAQLGVSEKAIESRLTRARHELRRELCAALARHE